MIRRAVLFTILCLSLGGFSTEKKLNTQAMDHPEKEGVPGAVEAPFADVNVVRTKIPKVLLVAEQAPYARPDPASCRNIAAEVGDLDDVLGDDFDVVEIDTSTPNARNGRRAGEVMVIAMRDTAEDFIPLRSWVRRLSGAQAHDNQVRAAVYAGRARRAYLKGVGQAMRCKYPAAPRSSASEPVKVLVANPRRGRRSH